MTLDEARGHVGEQVTYRAGHAGAAPEDGTVTSVTDEYVFVRYNGDAGSKATHPGDLSLRRFT